MGWRNCSLWSIVPRRRHPSSGPSIPSAQPTPEWPSDAFGARIPELAAVIENLIADERRWVHRRVETITLLDEQMVRRSTSVDFTLPTLAREPPDGVHYVPVTLLKKGLLRRLDVVDESGGALPVLTKQQNGPIAGEVLVGQATSLLGAEGPLIEPLRNQLHFLSDGVERTPMYPAESQRDQAEQQFSRLAEDEDFLGLLDDFTRQFLLIVPLRTRQGERRIIKFAYDSALSRELERGDDEGWLRYHLRRARRRLRNLAEVTGLANFTVGVETPALFDAESYHVEVVASDELIVASARLYRRMADDEPGPGDPGADAPPDQRWKVISRDDRVERAHLYTSDEPPRGVSEARVVAAFSLRPRVVWPALLFTGVASATFVAALTLHFAWDTSRLQDAPASLLVALPALFAPMAAPGVHALTRRMFKGLRALVLASALALLAAAATLVVQFSENTIERLWIALGSVPVVASILIGSAYLKSRRNTRTV